MTLSYETLRVPDDHDVSLVTFHAEPGSASEESLGLLAKWGVDEQTPTAAERGTYGSR